MVKLSAPMYLQYSGGHACEINLPSIFRDVASVTSVVTERLTASKELAMNLREPDTKLTINIPYTCVPYVLAVSTSSICLYVASVPRIRALAPRCCRLAQTHDGSSGQGANTRTESPLLARVATWHRRCTILEPFLNQT